MTIDNINNTMIFILLSIMLIFSGCVDTERLIYSGNNTNTRFCFGTINNLDMNQKDYDAHAKVCNEIEQTESYVFPLKEMKQKDLAYGKISGSFLLISGSIYGTIEDKMYLVATYYDPRINTYKITKFNLEEIEINTIGMNESPYFRLRVVPENDLWIYPGWSYDKTIGIFYLPKGWNII